MWWCRDEDGDDDDVVLPALVDVVLAHALDHQLRVGEEVAGAHPLDVGGRGGGGLAPRPVALNLAAGAEGGGGGWEVGILEQAVRLQVQRQKFLVVLTVKAAPRGPRIRRHIGTTSSWQDLFETETIHTSQTLFHVIRLYGFVVIFQPYLFSCIYLFPSKSIATGTKSPNNKCLRASSIFDSIC